MASRNAMFGWNTEADYLAWSKNDWYGKPIANYSKEDEDRDRLEWKLILHFEKLMQGYWDRGEARTLLAGHCADDSDKQLREYSLNPRCVAYYIASKVSWFTADWDGAMDEGLAVHRKFTATINAECDECEEKLSLSTDGISLEFDASYFKPCPYPSGVPIFTTLLNVPSGKLVYCDDLRDAFPEFNHDYKHPGLGSAAGMMRISKQYETLNVVAGCGISFSPGLFKVKNKIIVAAPGFNPSGERTPPKGWKKLGEVQTELRWVMMADHDEYVARGGKVENGSYYKPHSIDVEPGVYTVTHLEHSNITIKPLQFMEMERTGECEKKSI